MYILKHLILSQAVPASLLAAHASIEFRLEVPAKTQGAIEKKNDDIMLWVEPSASFDINDVQTAYVSMALNGFALTISLADEATRRFGDFSKAHIGSRLAILSRGRLISAPTIEEAITGGSIQIAGRFKAETVRELAKTIEDEKAKAQKP